MGINENLGTARTIVRTYSRPFPPGVPGELIRDHRTALTYRWSQDAGEWIAYGGTEQDLILYVDGVNGDDASDGAVATPLLSIEEALKRLPPEIRHNVTIDLQDNAFAPLTYEEAVVLENFDIYSPATLRISGKTRAAVIASGPNALAPDAGTGGDMRSITFVPDPGWTPGDLESRLVRFTAGLRIGEECIILANTSDTLFFGARADAAAGAYGPLDGLEILDITVLLQNALPNGRASLTAQNLTALDGRTAAASTIEIVHVRILGEIANVLAFECGGPVNLHFTSSTIEGLIFAVGHAGGSLMFTGSGLFHPGRLLDAIWNDLKISLVATGLLGSILLAGNTAGGTHARLTNCVCMFHPLSADSAVITMDSVSVYMASCCIVGSKAGVAPIALRSRSNLVLDMPYGNEIMDSGYSGIVSNLTFTLPGSGTGTVLLGGYDSLPPGEFENDFSDNNDYGIDLTGQYRLIVHTRQTSAIANGLGGCRLRWGAYYEFVGSVGQEPTIAGPAGEEVDFDDRAPALWLLWADDATGLETLAQMRQNGWVP